MGCFGNSICGEKMNKHEIHLAHHIIFTQGDVDMSGREIYDLLTHSNIMPEVAEHIAMDIRGEEDCSACGGDHDGYICPEQY